MLETFAPLWLAGILGAGIMAAVMASDSQILALSTMFTEDVFAYYGGKARFGENVQVQTGRIFVVILTVVAYVIALRAPQGIFDLAVQYAISGYSAMSPLLVAALFWKRSTKWGALAVTLWVAFAVIYTSQVRGGLAWYGLLPVVPMSLISCALMAMVSLVTTPPSRLAGARYIQSAARFISAAARASKGRGLSVPVHWVAASAASSGIASASTPAS